MTDKRFDFLELPYDIRWIVYRYISAADLRNLFLVCRKFTKLAFDITSAYAEWVIPAHKKTIDLDFHCKALTSSRMRDFTERLEIGFNFLRSDNVAKTISKFSYAVARMTRLHSMLLDFNQCQHETEEESWDRYNKTHKYSLTQLLHVNGSFLNVELIDLMIPNEHVQVLALRVKRAADLKPQYFDLEELLDRYPSLVALGVRFSERDIDADHYVEMLLTCSAPSRTHCLERVMIAYGASNYKVFNLQKKHVLTRVGGQDDAKAMVTKFKHFERLIE